MQNRHVARFFLLFKPLDALDAFQLCKALYALSIIVAAAFRLPELQVDAVDKTLAAIGMSASTWLLILSVYVVAAVLCLCWKHALWQTAVSFVSLFLWTFAGLVTLLSQAGPASGVFQLSLGLVSVLALYFRGRNR